MRNATLGVVAATVMSLAGIACASSDDGQSESSLSSFCDSAQTLPDKLFHDQYADGLVEALRELNTTGLTDADREELSSAIDLLEEQIVAFNTFDDGQTPSGWSTEPWSSVASRICGVEMWVQSVS